MEKVVRESIWFRIVRADGRIRFAGTGEDSWFKKADALAICDYSKEEKVYEYNPKTGDPIWEVL
jgi:alkylated DNA nucleotide flippase Atl1